MARKKRSQTAANQKMLHEILNLLRDVNHKVCYLIKQQRERFYSAGTNALED